MFKDDIFIGVNYSHDSSVCVIYKGEIVYYNEEERLNKRKHTFSGGKSLYEAYRICIKIANQRLEEGNDTTTVRTCVSPIFSGVDEYPHNRDNVEEFFNVIYNRFFLTNFNFVKDNSAAYTNIIHKYEYIPHHEAHANLSFYNSGFDESTVLVIDGGGEGIICHDKKVIGKSGESVFHMDRKNLRTEYLYQRVLSGGWTYEKVKSWGIPDNSKFKVRIFNKNDTFGRTFAYTSMKICNDFDGAGKLMGLSAYGKENPNIIIDPFKDLTGNMEWRRWMRENQSNIRENKIPREDVAYKVQKDSTKEIIKLVEYALSLHESKNLCLCGGVFYNIINNYEIVKAFPDINFYFEPIAGDQGVAIGAAFKEYRYITKDTTAKPLKTLYLGDQANYDRDLLPNEKEIHDVSPSDVAKLLEQRNVVALYQGRAEAGPRALGNRSFLYDPRDPDGRDIVNKFKKRQWYRPFAGTVLEEHAKEWFDLIGMDSSPWMMFAIECYEEKRDLVPALQHNDGTSRIQTLNREQNTNYYDLINEFYKLTGVPMLLNTSFNLAGDPLVNDMKDALETCREGKIPYLYCPERKMLIDFTENL